MSISNPFPKLLWAITLGGLAGIGLGCVISVGQLDCSECGNTGCNSQEVGNECVCDPGYEFADPDASDDFDCNRIPGKSGDAGCGGNDNIHLEGQVCVCNNGYNWCNDDVDDLSCCIDDDQAPDDGTDGNTSSDDDPTAGSEESADGSTVDDTGDPPETCEETEVPWNGVEPDAADCTDLGIVFCSNNEQEGPLGSRYWECDGAAWVENPTYGDMYCQDDGFEFAYGCYDNGVDVIFPCGIGPGTPCSGPECDTCADEDRWEYCSDGRLVATSCLELCTMEGDDQGATYDFGFCGLDNGVPQCICCDEGETDCPV